MSCRAQGHKEDWKKQREGCQDLQGRAITRVCGPQGKYFLGLSCLYKQCELI